MKKLVFFLLFFILLKTNAVAQGCVAIRNTGAVCTKPHADNLKGWRLNTSYRYFRSFRHFVGTEEQKERLEEHTEVINYQHALDIAVIRDFNSRWSMAISLPLISNKRSSLYEHYGNNSTSPNARREIFFP